MKLLIKGDAGFGPSERVNSQDVLGKVVAIERNGLERRLDTKLYRIICLFFAGLSPFSRWIYPIGSRVKHSGRRLLDGLYRKAGFHQISISELDEQLEKEAKRNSRLQIILAKHIQS